MASLHVMAQVTTQIVALVALYGFVVRVASAPPLPQNTPNPRCQTASERGAREPEPRVQGRAGVSNHAQASRNEDGTTS